MSRRLLLLSLIVVAVLVRPEPLSASADVSGAFRLAKDTYCVGEPIVVDFAVGNGTSSVFSFFEGGDYEGTLRHELYSFRVVNAAGRDFTQDVRGSLGGLGSQIKLESGQTFRSWQLLNGWVHLLPPGKYRAHCERKLSPDGVGSTDGDRAVEPITIKQELSFDVTPYSRDRIVAAIASMHEIEPSNRRVIRIEGVPVGWAVADLNSKFETGIDWSKEEGNFEYAVLGALPKRWDDRYYVEYGFKANRNWLTPDKPEDFELTISARNNGTADLFHGLGDSSMSVNGTELSAWPAILRKLMEQKKLGTTLGPGAVAEISGKFNDVLPKGERATLLWTIRDVKKSVDVRFGQ